MKNKKIIFFVNHAAFFVSHRLNLALAAKKKGFNIEIILGNPASLKEEERAIKILKSHKIKIKKFPFSSANINLLNNFISLLKILFYLKNSKIDIIHLISPKGIFLGGIVARIIKVKLIVISFSGMGYIFTNKLDIIEKIIKNIYLFTLKFILGHKNKRIIVHNYYDYNFLKKKFNLKKKEIIKTNGSGVNIQNFLKIKIKNNNKVVSFIGRIIEEKGVIEFIEAAKILKKIHKNWQFNLIGGLDYDKPSKFSEKIIDDWKKNKDIAVFGYQSDIKKFLSKSSIICLPSYREGMPKTILEASAAGRPVVATNVIGCNEAVINKKTGELCKVKSIKSLVQKLDKLIKNKKLREYYGRNGRNLAIKKFDIKSITTKLMSIYNENKYEKINTN